MSAGNGLRPYPGLLKERDCPPAGVYDTQKQSMHCLNRWTPTLTLIPSIPLRRCTLFVLVVLLTACTNNPYRPDETGRNIYYDTFSGEPKHLDPARAYSE